MASELQEALTSIVGLHRHAACFLALLAQSCQSIHATAAIFRYFQHGPSVLSDAGPALATLAAAGGGGHMAQAAAAAKLASCWRRVKLEPGACKQATEMGIMLLGALAAEHLEAQIKAGVEPSAAQRELLAALLQLLSASKTAGAVTGGLHSVDLSLAAALVAAFLAMAWGAEGTSGEELTDGMALIWQEGGVIHTLADALPLAVRPEAWREGLAWTSIAMCTSGLMLHSYYWRPQTQEAVFEWLLPPLLAAGSVAGSMSSEELIKLWELWDGGWVPVVTHLAGMLRVLAAGQDKGMNDIISAEQVQKLDSPGTIKGLVAVLVAMVWAVVDYDGPSRAGKAAWWVRFNAILPLLCEVLTALVGKREMQVSVFVNERGMMAVNHYIELYADACQEAEGPVPNPYLHRNASKLLELAAAVMAGTQGKGAQDAFGKRGVMLCLRALDALPGIDDLAVDPEPKRCTACKRLLRALETACFVNGSTNKDNCVSFLGLHSTQTVLDVLDCDLSPDAAERDSAPQMARKWGVLRSGISLLGSLADAPAHATGPPRLNDHFDFDSAFAGQLFNANQGAGRAIGLLHFVAYGIVVMKAPEGVLRETDLEVDSSFSLLGGALALLCCVGDSYAEEAKGLGHYSVYGPSVYLQTLHWGGRALQTAVEESGDLTNLRPFVEVVRMLVERAPSCQPALLSLSYLKLVGKMLATAAKLQTDVELPQPLLQAFRRILECLFDQQQPAVRCKAIALEADDVAAACCRSGGRQQLGEVFALLQEVDERTTAWHVRNAAALEQKRREAEAVANSLLEEEEAAEREAAGAAAKKAAKKAKQKQKKKEQEQREAAEKEAAAAAAAAEAAARQAQRQAQREEQRQRREQQKQEQAEAAAASKKQKKKKGKEAPATAAGDGGAQQQAAPGPAASVPAAAATPAAPPTSLQEEPEELQELLAHLGLYPTPTPASQPGAPEHQQQLEQQQQQQQLEQQQQQQPAGWEPSLYEQQQQQEASGSSLPAPLRAVLSCPLTGRLLVDPVILGDGHSYERAAAEAWLAAGNSCSPLTGEPLALPGWRPNHALRQLLEEGV